MPLTTSHPAAVVLLGRIFRLPGALAALVIGSMAPDFMHFLPWSVPREEAHSKLGLFWFALPVGALAYLGWHALVKRPALYLLPAAVRRRIRPALSRFPSLRSARGCGTIALALLVGAVSHLAWDAFTHETGLVVRAFPWLETLVDVGPRRLPLYAALQHASTAAGGVFLLAWAGLRLRGRERRELALDPPFAPSARAPLAAVVVLVASLSGLVPALSMTGGPVEATRDFLYVLYVKGITGATVVLAGIGSIWWLREGSGRRERRERARTPTV